MPHLRRVTRIGSGPVTNTRTRPGDSVSLARVPSRPAPVAPYTLVVHTQGLPCPPLVSQKAPVATTLGRARNLALSLWREGTSAITIVDAHGLPVAVYRRPGPQRDPRGRVAPATGPVWHDGVAAGGHARYRFITPDGLSGTRP
jgi:hypothetical protein